jgi:quercetin dioxygenase-like cupin family protein
LPKSTVQGVYANIENMIEFAKDGIVSKTVLKAPDKEVNLFCMSTGQMLSSHTSSYPAIVHVLRGKGEITLAKKKYEATTNAWFYMPANLSHALLSTDNLVFLLTLFKGAG